jgi:hypothetical protein
MNQGLLLTIDIVQYDVYITLIFNRYIMKFVLFISVLLASCMVVEGAQSSDTGPTINVYHR